MTRTDLGLVVGAAASAAALLTVGLPRADPTDPGTVVALALLGVSIVAAWVSPTGHVRRAAIVAGTVAAMLLVVSVGRYPTATLVERDLQLGLSPMVLPLLAATLIRSRWLATGAAVGGVLAGPVRTLVYDPFLDPGCVSCAHGRLVVWPDPRIATVVHTLGSGITIAAVLLAVARRLAPAVTVALLGCLAASSVDGGGDEAVLVGGGVTAAYLATVTASAWRRRREVRRLLQALDSGDDLTTVLRHELGDDGLVVTFPDGDDFVDRSGVVVRSGDQDATTELLIDGAPAARVHHAAGTRVPDVGAQLDDAARLALGNERLTAQLAARVNQLGRARAAVVESGVRERRVLERDLHDGVQQDLLALGLDLRVAADRLAPDDPDRILLDDAVVEVRAALDDVREISHGVYPPLLATRGLAAATASLARRAPVSVEVGSLPDRRFADAVERAAFAVLAEAVDRGARHVDAEVVDGRLVVRASGAGPGIDGIVPDVVAAVGGTVVLGSPTITAVIPCA